MKIRTYFNFKGRFHGVPIIMVLIPVLLISGCSDKKTPVQTAVSKPASVITATNQPDTIETKCLYPIRVEEKGKVLWGYIDDTGKVVFKPQWEGAESFKPYGIARVYNVDKNSGTNNCGIVDYKGNEIIPIKKGSWDFPVMGPEYIVACGSENEGTQKSIVYDMGGKELFITDRFIQRYSDGYFIFYNDGLWGLLDKTGKEIKSGVKDENELIKKMGNTINDVKRLTIFNTADMSKYGLKDSLGKVIVPAKYDFIMEYDDGENFLCQNRIPPNTEFELLGKDGKPIPLQNASDVQHCGKGLYLVCSDEDIRPSMIITHRYKIFDVRTANMSEPVYVLGINNIIENSEKTNDISIYDGNKSFLTGRDGKQIAGSKTFEGKWIISHEGNLIKVASQSHSGDGEFFAYYNEYGKEIWKTNYEFDLGKGRTLKKAYYSPNIFYSASYFELNDTGNSTAEEKFNSWMKKVIEDGRGVTSMDQVGIESKYLISNDLLTVILSKSSYGGGGMGNYDNYYYHFNLNTGVKYENLNFLKKGDNYKRKFQELVKKRFDTKYKEAGTYPQAGLDIFSQNNYFTPDGIVFILDGYKFHGKILVKFSEIEDLIDRNADIFKACDLTKYAQYVEE